jgi:hypothetical protein
MQRKMQRSWLASLANLARGCTECCDAATLAEMAGDKAKRGTGGVHVLMAWVGLPGPG